MPVAHQSSGHDNQDNNNSNSEASICFSVLAVIQSLVVSVGGTHVVVVWHYDRHLVTHRLAGSVAAGSGSFQTHQEHAVYQNAGACVVACGETALMQLLAIACRVAEA
jgi:hypothetical protein